MQKRPGDKKKQNNNPDLIHVFVSVTDFGGSVWLCLSRGMKIYSQSLNTSVENKSEVG